MYLAFWASRSSSQPPLHNELSNAPLSDVIVS